MPAYLGFVWVVGVTGYLFYTNVLSGSLTALGSAALSGVCLGMIAFAVSAIWPLGVAEDGSKVPRDFWGFVLGERPDQPYLGAVWSKFRRSIAVLLITLASMLFWGVLVSLGMAHVRTL